MGLIVRDLHPGMGVAVAERTVLRKQDGRYETWSEVAARVATGNTALAPAKNTVEEFFDLRNHVAKGVVLMSGRHLQHGDDTQPERNLEVFTNCSTSATSFALFMLLLNGSGVGRCYDDDFVLTDWDCSPQLRIVISNQHADFDWQSDEDVRDARHKYVGRNVIWHEVEDSREGWAKAIELYELLTWERIHAHQTLVLDFSKVRPKGAPIKGMQNRPSSGPKPLMGALRKISTIKGSGLQPWMQALYVDHYLAECVLVGGARRAARMSTKIWSDEGIFDFIKVKRPVEYSSLCMEEVVALRAERTTKKLPPLDPFLWSSNNSVMVDAEFWERVDEAMNLVANGKTQASMSRKTRHAYKVWTDLTECAYADGTGEPGIINCDKLVSKDEGFEALAKSVFAGGKKYAVDEDTQLYLAKLAKAALKKPFHYITNPCGEIVLSILGGYCVIADVVPFHADNFAEIESAMRATTRALIRTNLMHSFYDPEVKRTNRIGVGLTGVHEFAWKFFKVGFRDLINPYFMSYKANAISSVDGQWQEHHETSRVRSAGFWMFLSHLSNAIVDEAKTYCAELGVTVPHTMLTIKPAGTTSKLFGLTEGWHLPSMREYLRWVQFKDSDPLVAEYEAKGYPVRRGLKTYRGMTIVGFPTQPLICTIGIPDDQLVTAGEATPEDQYKWLKLGERFWIDGQTDPDDLTSGHGYGNQVSYTLKYDPKIVNYDMFEKILRENQRHVRACSVMPQEDGGAYEYQPEQPLAKGEYQRIAAAITEAMAEDVGKEHILCDNGACPTDFEEGDKSLVPA
jgi:adenosylcobalamin-dependent ribonucleoside-triphosphate reductase